MSKIVALVGLVLLALPIAGMFGVLHDQVSFTVSSEYFTKFKFLQFGLLDPTVLERIRVAQVGFLASWWMGVPIGLLVSPAALIHRSAYAVLRFGLQSYLALVIFTALFAIGGLLYGFYQTRTIALQNYHGWFVPADIVDLRSFLCVGYMHNAAYLGGVVGVVVAWLFHVRVRLRTEPNKAPEPTTGAVTPRAPSSTSRASPSRGSS
jgi:hypothetical protein